MSPYRGITAQQPSNSPAPIYMDTTDDSASSSSTAVSLASGPPMTLSRSATGPVPQYQRSYLCSEPSRAIQSPTPLRPVQLPDRSSTHSLPLPMHTPYHTLPSMQGGGERESVSEGEGTPAPPSTASLPSSSSFPQAGASTRVESLPSATASTINTSVANANSPNPNAGALSRAPGWARGNAEPRRVQTAPTTPTGVAEPRIMPPQPPTVLTPPPPILREHVEAAHEPFLSQAPPPQDSYLAVETSGREYQLIARLPGFRRDAM